MPEQTPEYHIFSHRLKNVGVVVKKNDRIKVNVDIVSPGLVKLLDQPLVKYREQPVTEKKYMIKDFVMYPAVEFDENGKHIGGRLWHMINTDAYYEIGAGHTFCEDYADHGKFIIDGKPFRFAIVCDGCSSSKGSDVGARLLAKWFPKAFIDSYRLNFEAGGSNPESFVAANLVEKIKQNSLDIEPTAYDATVVALVYDEFEDTLHSFAWGDGKIFYKYKNENGFLTDIGFVSNAPYYLSYGVNPQRDSGYEKAFGSLYADIVPYNVKPDGLVAIQQDIMTRQKSFYEKLEQVSTVLSHATVFTDGVDTFHNKDDMDIKMPKHNIYTQLSQYKSVHGDFVQRRMNGAIKFCKKEGWQHFDDIAVATITF